MPVEEGGRETCILSSKDLCIIPKPEDLMRIGVDRLKVEGRGKGMYYVAIIARTYRMVIDNWYNDPKSGPPMITWKNCSPCPIGVTPSSFTKAAWAIIPEGTRTHQPLAAINLGLVLSVQNDAFIVLAKNKLEAGDV